MPADTYSATLGLLLMGTGNDNNTWGSNANSSVFQIVEDSIANLLTSTVTGGTLDLSGSPPPAGPSQVRYAALRFSGTLASNQSVKVPNLSKIWLVHNNTSGAYTLTFTTPSGSPSAALVQGQWSMVWCDGSNNIYVSSALTPSQLLAIDGTVGAPGISYANEPTSGIYRKAAGVIGISILGAEILEISASGVTLASGVASGFLPSGVEQMYAGIELPAGGFLWCDGTTYSRTSYANLFNAITRTATATTAISSATLTGVSVDLRYKGLVGGCVEGTGIPNGTIITAISASTITMSATATANGTVTIRCLPWGQGDGSTTFPVPDRRYKMLIGRDDMNANPANRWAYYYGNRLATGNYPDNQGQEYHQLTGSEMPSHQHNMYFNDPSHLHGAPNARNIAGGTGTPANSYDDGGIGVNTAYAYTGCYIGSSPGVNDSTTTAAGGNGAHNNMPPFAVTNFIIKT